MPLFSSIRTCRSVRNAFDRGFDRSVDRSVGRSVGRLHLSPETALGATQSTQTPQLCGTESVPPCSYLPLYRSPSQRGLQRLFKHCSCFTLITRVAYFAPRTKRPFLRPEASNARAKNIKYNKQTIKHMIQNVKTQRKEYRVLLVAVSSLSCLFVYWPCFAPSPPPLPQNPLPLPLHPPSPQRSSIPSLPACFQTRSPSPYAKA